MALSDSFFFKRVIVSTQNKEIKFRAWFPEAKRMIRFGGTFGMNAEYNRLCFDIFTDDCTQLYQHLAGESYIPSGKFELMQFTGLHDKNSVEIYEGDIVRIAVFSGTNLLKVIFARGGFMPVAWHIKDDEYAAIDNGFSLGLTPDNSLLRVCEVIGNIYENPELLK
jgi:uncharacterized phage protein (TIGR01671 family)